MHPQSSEPLPLATIFDLISTNIAYLSPYGKKIKAMDITRSGGSENVHGKRLPRCRCTSRYIRASSNVLRRRKEPKMDPTFPLVPIANFVACLLILLSVSKSMFQAWNVGACSFAFWTALSGFGIAVNSIIWSDNAENKAPIWCDISEHSFSLHRKRLMLTVDPKQQHTLQLPLM